MAYSSITEGHNFDQILNNSQYLSSKNMSCHCVIVEAIRYDIHVYTFGIKRLRSISHKIERDALKLGNYLNDVPVQQSV